VTTTGVILITGTSTGIGRSCALALDRHGYRVVAGVRNDDDAKALKDEGSERIVPIRLDVTDEAQIAESVRSVERVLADDPFVGLINNAGIVVSGPLEFLQPADLRRQLEVNLVGHLAVTQAFMPLLRRFKGRIVFTGSLSGVFTTPLLGPYCMSKYAMEALCDALRLELKPWGIKVILLQPGAIATPIWDKGIRKSEESFDVAPQQLRELYTPMIEDVQHLMRRIERSAAPTDVVAKSLLRAVSARRPKPRYTMGQSARAQHVIARLPTRLRDWLIARLLPTTARRAS
jgi:NAD(P)-dependent dehydrogenase (short-subunit alcohol dehydrogenase family)